MPTKLTYQLAKELWDTDLGLVAAAKSVPCQPKTLRDRWIRIYREDAYLERRARIKGDAVRGENHPTAKPEFQGKNHWNYDPDASHVCSMGYRKIHPPDWWEGPVHNGYVHEHRIVYCEHHGITDVPEGYVIHHINEDKLDNRPANLEMMTRAEHASLHHWANAA